MGQRIDQQSIQVLGVPSAPKATIDQLAIQVLAVVVNPIHQLSGYLKDALIDHIFRSAAFPKPLGLWISLFTLPPSPTSDGIEVTGNAYARCRYDPSEANWTPPTSGDGTTSNGFDITFVKPTGPWGLIMAYGIHDSASGGNLLAYSTIATPRSVDATSSPRFVAGDLTVTLN